MKIFQFVFCAVGVFALAGRADAVTLFGATASGSPGELYVINFSTGALIQDVGPLNDATGLNYGMTGLAFHPSTGVLYGSTHNKEDAEPATLARLVTINPATAQVTVIGAFNAGNAGRPATMTDLAFDAAGNLFGVSSVGGPQLYSINAATGQATVIGDTGLTSTTGGGLAISRSRINVFYGTPTVTRFGTYDSTTGVYTNIANPAKPGGGGSYAALDFHPVSGALYGLNSATGNPPPTFLAIIDPATGAVTSVGQSVNALDAIAFRIPEPAAMPLLLTAGLAGVRRMSRRRASN